MSRLEIDNLQELDELSEDEEGAIRLGDIYIPPPFKPATDYVGGKRLFMVQIVTKNFKSFYGEVRLGPFDSKFTAIIGPNGSGKSNVIDALMFVFGSRANRIRSKKLSTLIHDSSEHRGLTECSVQIHYKQIVNTENDYFEVPDSEIVIARTVLKNNTSFYMLNNQRVEFKKIFLLLKSHGVDLDHNRFLILQGEVEQIALMRNKARNEHETGMLEFLEDIIGTSRYNNILKKIEARVEQLEQERCSKRDHVELAAKEVADSKIPRDKAVAYYRTENQITQYKHTILQRHLFDAEQCLQDVEKQKLECSNEIKVVKDKLQHNEKLKSELDLQNKQFKKTNGQLLSQMNSLDERFNKANNDDASKGEEAKIANKNRKSQMEKLQVFKINLEKLKAIPKNNTNEIDECEKKLESLSKQLKKESTALEECKTKINQDTGNLVSERNQHELKLKPLKQESANKTAEYNMLASELKLRQRKESQAVSNLNLIKNQLSDADRDLQEKNNVLQELQNTIKISEEELKTSELELQHLTQLESKINSDKQKNDTLLREYQDVNRNQSRSYVLDFLRKKREDGDLQGLFGRLGDLGGIDAMYDIAISTACGALENIVVDNIKTAQKCVDLLKQYNVGRATFIALDKQQHFWGQIQMRFHSPENLPRLFDLVHVQDERIRPALYFALRDTLVADDLDQATRVAYGAKRYRVVTLRGELIELTGTLSGGGNRPRRGLMSRQVSERTINNISSKDFAVAEQESNRIEKNLQECLQKRDVVEQRVHQLRRSVASDNQKYSAMLHVNKSLVEECKRLNEQLVKSSLIKIDVDKIRNLEDSVKSKKKDLDEFQQIVDKVENELKICNEKIASSLGDSVQAKQAIVNNLKKEINKFQSQITKLKIAIGNNAKKVENLEEQIRVTEASIEECKTQIIKLRDERCQLEEVAKEILTQKEEVQRKINELQVTSRESIRRLKTINKLDMTLKSKLMELENELSTYQDKIKLYSRESSNCKAQINKLMLNDSMLTDSETEFLKTYSRDEIGDININNMKNQILMAEKIIKTQKLEPNLNAIKMYTLSVTRQEEALALVRKIIQEWEKTRELLNQLQSRRLKEFMVGFAVIRHKCREFYRMISFGGDADLELVDYTDPFEAGIILNIRPPKKSWKAVMNLSGGEKTLASLSFVFAVHHYRPSPFYLMDEVDAALDFRNVNMIGHFIRRLTETTQFIIISLSETMFRLSDRIIGIFKISDCTGSILIGNGVLLEMYFQNEISPIVNNNVQSYNTGLRRRLSFGDACEEEDGFEVSQNETQPLLAQLPLELEEPLNKRQRIDKEETLVE